jgi:RNA polymerase sigma-70 factor, ECF subfamily
VPQNDVTQLLLDWSKGDKDALDQLTPLVYDELRRLAGSYLRRESAPDMLQPTALVHEAYLRLVNQNLPEWQSRSHFFGIAAHLMRQILVDHARAQRSQKRGGGAAPVTLNEAISFAPERGADVIALDEALKALAEADARKAKIIELRHFGGFSVEETAQALGVSVATISRETRMAEAWLYRELNRTSE